MDGHYLNSFLLNMNTWRTIEQRQIQAWRVPGIFIKCNSWRFKPGQDNHGSVLLIIASSFFLHPHPSLACVVTTFIIVERANVYTISRTIGICIFHIHFVFFLSPFRAAHISKIRPAVFILADFDRIHVVYEQYQQEKYQLRFHFVSTT